MMRARADERMSERGGKAADGRAVGGGNDADSGADERTGPTRRGQGPAHADGRIGRSEPALRGRRVGRTGGWADWADGRTGSPPVGRSSGWAWV